jgi:formiminotetrahydrofolate cyclodeaminase
MLESEWIPCVHGAERIGDTPMTEPTTATQLAQPYIDQIASVAPTPGGGSASAVTGSIGTGLLEMIATLSLKTATGESKEVLDDLIPIFNRSRSVLLELGGEDEKAYGGYRSALSLPKSSAAEKSTRKTALQDALIHATAVPLETAELALELMQLVPALAEVASPHLEADLTVATALLGASINGSVALVNANLPLIKDEDAQDEVASRVEQILATFTEIIEAEWDELQDEEDDDDEDDDQADAGR